MGGFVCALRCSMFCLKDEREKMYKKRRFLQLQAKNLSKTFGQQSRAAFANRVTLYLHRAKLIDSIRLALRSPSSAATLTPLLNSRLADSLVVTQSLRSAPSAESAIWLVKTLEAVPSFEHCHNTVNSLATVLAKFKRNAELKKLIDDINGGKFGEIRLSYMNLMKWYYWAGDVEAVLRTWDAYRLEEKWKCSTESYNIVMRLYAQKGENRECLNIFRGMICNGELPNSRTYTVLIEHLVSLGKLDSALEVFRMLPCMRIKRTSMQFSVLVDGFAVARRFNEVKALFRTMTNEGKLPGPSMRLCLQKLEEEGFLEEPGEFLTELIPDERIKSIGCNEDQSDDNGDEEAAEEDGEWEHVDNGAIHEVRLKPWLDPKALANALREWGPEVVAALNNAQFVWTNRLVCKVLRSFKSAEVGWDFFCWVTSQPGFTHDIQTVVRMMSLLARHGNVTLVDKLIVKIKREGMLLPFSTIRLLIDSYGISKNPDAALKVFREHRTLCGSVSSFNLMLLYSSLLRALTKCDRNTDALDMLDEMILNGTFPDIQTFTGLVYHFARLGDIKIVQQIISLVRQSGMEPDAYMYRVLVKAYCKCGRPALAWRVFEDMRNVNLMPDEATKELLVKSLWNEGKRREAAAVEESWEEMDGVRPITSLGQTWTVSSADLTRVYDIYSKSLT